MNRGLIQVNDMRNDEATQLSLKLFVIMTRSFQSVQKRALEDISRYGLNQTEFAVLELLYNKGNQPIQQIGKKILLASSSMTYVIDKLEEKMYIKRKACAKDRRVTYAHLTEKGNNIMKDIFPQHAKALKNIFSSLTNDEKETLIKQLKKVGLYAESLKNS